MPINKHLGEQKVLPSLQKKYSTVKSEAPYIHKTTSRTQIIEQLLIT